MFFRRFTLKRGIAQPAPATGSGPPPSPAEPAGTAPTGSPKLTAIPGGAARSRPTPSHDLASGASGASGGGDVDDVGPVLDTLGRVLTALARNAFDLPDRSAEQIASELQRWQRHATLGVPVQEVAGPALGVRERDWDGVTRTFTEHRRQEARYVETTVTELRDAVWAMVGAVHNAVQAEAVADRTTDVQLERARTALTQLPAGTERTEALDALSALEEASRVRREQRQAHYHALAGRIERLGSQLAEPRRDSTTDELTGLGNRKHFKAMAQRAVHLHALSRQPVALLMMDLDAFKLVNGAYGHRAGDQTLLSVAQCLSMVFPRQSDVVCRYGGDEFAVILNNTGATVAQQLTRRLLEAVASMPAPHPNMTSAVGASVGIAVYDGEEKVDAWIARADRALSVARQNGSERFVLAGVTLVEG